MDARISGALSTIERLQAQLEAGLVGHERLVERLLVAVLTGGHVLLEGAPGLAKTRAVKRLSQAVDLGFARIQCTPDLMPSDLTGTSVYKPQDGSFDFVPGPVFHNLVLVDEINRAPPKVQSALLEAMAEGQVTAGNLTHPLPDPFLVIATQNPIEHDGTFPLPEAQLDRFMMHVMLDLPDLETERRILDLVEAESQGTLSDPDPMPLPDLLAARDAVRNVHLAPELQDYIVRLVMASRSGAQSDDIAHAISPRGSIALAAASRARAYLQGRDYAVPEDVAAMAPDALAHRLVLTWRAVADGRKPRDLIADFLAEVEPL